MASKKTPAANKLANRNSQKAKSVVVKAAATKTATRTVPVATGPVALIGVSDAVCANLAALRAALAGEKAREGAAERKKAAKDLEALEAGYRELPAL
jgi:hypothetical protein